ncbi:MULTISPECIES: DUF2332 domain-containing protein [unclassified Knoellia]|uniref:DUF2332 domain-containing protein n=1 Tax=Knoellia altitudinis TaxID=3404795 RepID=UPI0036242AF4
MKDHMAGLCLAQAELCSRLGSPMYAALLESAAEDVRAGGPTWEVLRDLAGCSEGAYPALRLLGSVHRVVLEGRAPELAVHYPSVGGTPGEGLWEAFRAVVVEHSDELRALVEQPPQTNEVGRSAALLGGFTTVAGRTGLPLRVLEVGTSAGLNLLWDRYRYESDSWSWGDADAPVVIDDVFDGPAPDLAPARVVERAGCDLDPVDVTQDAGRLTLLSFIWPDQHVRRGRLEAAIQAFRDADPQPAVERADALTWLDERLAQRLPGVATVVTHSVVVTYFDDESRRALDELLTRHGRAATPDAPLARLSLEADSSGQFEVRLRSWPSGVEELLGTVGGHGLPVRWASSLTPAHA